MRIPPDRLSPEALRGLIEEFVTREGTDYGHMDHPFEEKVRAVRRQLDRGEAIIVFDPATETCNLVLSPDAP
ncbi:MAG: YheU family protein [Myxococcota bacterium]